MEFTALIGLITLALEAFEKARDSYILRAEKKTRIIEALTALKQAIIETEAYISLSGYQPNEKLSGLWLTAFQKVKIANLVNDFYEIDRLYDKGKFWSNPRLWLEEKGAMELVPKLKDLNDHCESLLVRINNF